ncbi:Formin-like protein 3 [Phytophthora ramorum]|uniref:Formin-like protein 3 n=1 Tax=Phytophthora ramorum TaxID=164328 RepID=UPI0030B276F5|nr:Formin-like protein 3 [Phytophthora ramorum]
MEGARQGLFSPTNADGLGPAAAAAAAVTPTTSRSRASLSSKLSMAPDDAFAREPDCGVCSKSFNILRRRHHCRSCHIAVCKECGRKAVDRKKPVRSRPQWYCLGCLDDDATLEITGSRPTASKRRSFSTSSSSFAPTNAPQVTNLTSTAKFCIECGYELPLRVKFCIECGTSVRQQVMSPVSVDGVGAAEIDRGNRGFRDSLGTNLLVIDEHSGSPTEPTDGSEDDAPVEQEPEDHDPVEKKVEVAAPEGDEYTAAKTKEYEELVAQLQAENEKLRTRVEKFKHKISEAERRRQEREEEHARAVSEATAAATAAAEAQANNRRLPPPTEAVKVDPSALKASLASKLNNKAAPKKPEEPQLPKKETVKPNVELRPLFWTRVPVNVVSSTVWMKLNDSHAEMDVDEMEWMFRKNPVDASKKIDEKKKEAEKVLAQPKEVLLFDPKRQQNVSIAIARFKMSSEDIKNAIYALDGQKLGSEVLNVLISISPTLEEIDMLKNYDGDVKLLGNVEKFFLDLLTIPRYTQRIKCFRYKLQFENRILETQAQLDTLVAATDQVAESDKFRRVLEHILAIGNYLNGSTPRGGAYGFKLDTLMKLHTLKSVDPRVTLMHFLLRQLEEKSPDVITFAGEVPHIVEAKRLSLDQLRADLSSYNTELAMLKGQVRASKNDHIEGDKFYEVMTPFAKDAEEVLEELGRDFNGLETCYQELVSSFGEDPRKVGPMEFFNILDEFVTEFKKAYRQNQTKEYQTIYEEAAAARAAAVAEKAERLKHEAEERQRLEEERQQNSQETKAIYAEIMSIITAWAGKHSPGNEDAVIEQFKESSRKFGLDEITADEFCDQVRQCVGSKTAGKIIPNSAKLLSDEEKQSVLLEAFARFKGQVKKEKESKKQQRNSLVSPPSEGRERAGSSSAGRRRNKVTVPLPIKDIEPVVGEEAQLLHKSILESVLAAFGGDPKKMKSFTSHTRKYGNEQITAHEFYQYLMESFDPDFVGRLVPDLARLLQDSEKRHALIRALCESAPGWAKFAGL